MSRTPHSPDEIVVVTGPATPNEQAFLAADTEARQIERLVMDNATALADRIGYEGTLTLGSIEDEIRFFQRRTIEACLELGKRLLVMKELTGHGEFQKRVELLGISLRMANKFMASTLKFSKSPPGALLKAAGNQSKLLELLVLDDCEIEALNNGESARGIKLDDIESMSRNELQAALKDARETSDARSEVIAKKESRINALEEDLHKSRHRLASQTPDEVGEQLRQETAGVGWSIVGRLNVDLAKAFAALDAHARAADCSHDEFMSGVLFDIQRAVHAIREDYAVKERPDGDARPDWTRPDYNPQLDADTEASRQNFIKEHGYDPMPQFAAPHPAGNA